MSTTADSLAVSWGGQREFAPSSRWIEWFFGFQIACQLALIVPGMGGARMLVRVAAFGGSLLFLLAFPPRSRRHPASWFAMGIMLLLGLSVLHPMTNTITAGLAQALLYVAILAPLIWVSGLRIDEAGLRRILLMLWAFHTLSSIVGVIQVSFPGILTPQVSSVVAGQGDWYVEDMKIALASGTRVFRPMGLTDYPGGAATAGFYCVLLGLGLWAGEKNAWLKVAYILSLPAAMFCLYLSQMRSMMVMTAVCAIAFMGILAIRGEGARVANLGAALAGMVALSFVWASAVGGESVTRRLSSLFEEKPSEVYYANRGHFLEKTVNDLLPKYPMGAGLGRWGMMHYYFADKKDKERGEIWAEIQWTGWLLDGGVPLILLYCGAMVAAFWVAGRIAMDRTSSTSLAMLGAMVLAYNFGALAMTFNYPLFIGQGGLEFWIINACLFGAWQWERWRAAAVHELQMHGLEARDTRTVPERVAPPSEVEVVQ